MVVVKRRPEISVYIPDSLPRCIKIEVIDFASIETIVISREYVPAIIKALRSTYKEGDQDEL